MNIYLLFGLENYLINKYLNDIIKTIGSDNIIKYDMNNDTISSVLVEASSISMFSDKKIIIVDNALFLTSNKSLKDNEVEELTKYMEKPYDDVYIILIVREEKLDQRKKITKLVNKVSKVYECNKIESYKLNDYLNNYFRDNGYSITSPLIDLIISKQGNELGSIINEIDKLFIYKGENKIITKEDIDEVITNNLEKNIFELTNAIVNKDKMKINKIYNDLIKIGEDPIKLIVTLSNQFRLLLQVKLMRTSGYSEKEIVTTLKEHPYRINLAMKNSFEIKKIKEKLLELSKINYEIVTGKVDKYFAFEMFLFNL